MGRLRSRKFLIIPTRQYFYKDTKNSQKNGKIWINKVSVWY